MQKTESFLLTHTPDLLWSSLRKWKQSGARREMSGMTRPEESVVLMIMMMGVMSDESSINVPWYIISHSGYILHSKVVSVVFLLITQSF